MFCKHLEMMVDENETSVLMVCHPMIVKDLFLDITRLFDYNIYVRIDGKELEYLFLVGFCDAWSRVLNGEANSAVVGLDTQRHMLSVGILG